MAQANLFTKSDALFSACGLYRYTLSRTWGDEPAVCWIMLNPSKATAEISDPTVTRCIRFAERWGAGGIVVVNLFALRSTDPGELYKSKAPIGQQNDWHIQESARGRRVVAAWGNHGGHLGRAADVLAMLRAADVGIECLGWTKAYQPKHPLYVAADTPLRLL